MNKNFKYEIINSDSDAGNNTHSHNSSTEFSNSTTSHPVLLRNEEGVDKYLENTSYETIELHHNLNEINITQSGCYS